jgi:hypothetical protein
MKVNRPSWPLRSGAEPRDPQEQQQAAQGERFAASSNPVRAGLEEVANNSTLTDGEGAATAVRESARFMVCSRLNEKFRESEQGTTLVERLSEFVATDPLLHSKLLGILHKVKTV